MNWKGKEQLVQFNSKVFINEHVSASSRSSCWAWTFLCLARHIFQRGNLKGGRSKEITALEGNKRTKAGQGNVGAL